MAGERPTAAFVLSLVGAIFHVIGGAIIMTASAIMTAFVPGLGVTLFALAALFMVLAVVGAVLIYTAEKDKVMIGSIITLIVAITAFATLWGFFIGSILGFVGAILGLVWKPEVARICLSCGRQIPVEYNVCPHCGAPVTMPAGPVPPTPPTQP